MLNCPDGEDIVVDAIETTELAFGGVVSCLDIERFSLSAFFCCDVFIVTLFVYFVFLAALFFYVL